MPDGAALPLLPIPPLRSIVLTLACSQVPLKLRRDRVYAAQPQPDHERHLQRARRRSFDDRSLTRRASAHHIH